MPAQADTGNQTQVVPNSTELLRQVIWTAFEAETNWRVIVLKSRIINARGREDRFADVGLFAVMVAFYLFVTRLPLLLIFVASLLWFLERFGYIWKDKPNGDMATSLLLVAASWAVYIFSLHIARYRAAVRVFREIESRSIKSATNVSGSDETRALSRFAGESVLVVAEGDVRLVTHSPLNALDMPVLVAPVSEGLVVSVLRRGYLVGWDQIKSVRGRDDEAEVFFTAGLFEAEGLIIPWSPELTKHLPARFRPVIGGSC